MILDTAMPMEFFILFPRLMLPHHIRAMLRTF